MLTADGRPGSPPRHVLAARERLVAEVIDVRPE
jgi:hypothetical protein